MTQSNIFKNITHTACVGGLVASSVNSTIIIDGRYPTPTPPSSVCYDNSSLNSSSEIYTNNSFEYKPSKLEKEATELFGLMRDATYEEQESINKYIDTISKDTGVNFFNLC